MKKIQPLIASISFAVLMLGSVLFASHYKAVTRYSQIFAEKRIVLTEVLTLQEKLLLKHKKGFIQYEN